MTEYATDELLWDPADPRQIADPYPAYERLRTEAPLWRHPVAWVLSTYTENEKALRDRRLLNHGLDGDLLTAKLFASVPPPYGERTKAHQRPWLLFQSGDHHSLMRRLLNVGFSASSLERIRPQVEIAVGELVDRMRDERSVDFMSSFAVPLPVQMICDLFGVPAEYRLTLRDVLGPLARTMAGVPLTAEVMQDVDAAVARFEEAMRDLIARRRAHPSDDMISLLLEDGDHRSFTDDDEVIANLGVLLFAGHETTVGLLGNGLTALLRNPEQRALLTAEPGRAAEAVEEALRYDAPAQRVARVVHEPAEYCGTTLERGDLLWLLLGSANRDTLAHQDPDVFDIARRTPRPLSFGKGPHFCIGAPLARMEAQIAFPAVLEAMANFQLADETITYNANATLRAPSELRLTR